MKHDNSLKEVSGILKSVKTFKVSAKPGWRCRVGEGGMTHPFFF